MSDLSRYKNNNKCEQQQQQQRRPHAQREIKREGESVTRMKGKDSTRRRVESRQAVTRRTLLVNAFVLARNKHRKDSTQTPQDTPLPSHACPFYLLRPQAVACTLPSIVFFAKLVKNLSTKTFATNYKRKGSKFMRGGEGEGSPLSAQILSEFTTAFFVLWRLF